jgi:hypothetical protein
VGEPTFKTSNPDSWQQLKDGLWGSGGTNPAWWYSHRLKDAALTQLSEDIVREVRKRGPFLSLSQFVNRSLSSDDLGRAGALQAALDVTRGSGDINSFIVAEQKIDFDGEGFYAEPLDTRDPTVPGVNHHANRMKGLAGWVMQGDILGSLGSVMSARSDTFVIRAYGDAVNSVTGDVSARAYCEAVVQRLPEYVDSSDLGVDSPISPVNQRFGRRFTVLSFRWLEPSSI